MLHVLNTNTFSTSACCYVRTNQSFKLFFKKQLTIIHFSFIKTERRVTKFNSRPSIIIIVTLLMGVHTNLVNIRLTHKPN